MRYLKALAPILLSFSILLVLSLTNIQRSTIIENGVLQFSSDIYIYNPLIFYGDPHYNLFGYILDSLNVLIVILFLGGIYLFGRVVLKK